MHEQRGNSLLGRHVEACSVVVHELGDQDVKGVYVVVIVDPNALP